MSCTKYACHRLYDTATHYYSQMTVCVNGSGKVDSFSTLTEETSFTQWIGGIIILSDKTDIPPYQNFQQLIQELTSSNQEKVYAWHISTFDFQTESLTAESVIKRLY